MSGNNLTESMMVYLAFILIFVLIVALIVAGAIVAIVAIRAASNAEPSEVPRLLALVSIAFGLTYLLRRVYRWVRA